VGCSHYWMLAFSFVAQTQFIVPVLFQYLDVKFLSFMPVWDFSLQYVAHETNFPGVCRLFQISFNTCWLQQREVVTRHFEKCKKKISEQYEVLGSHYIGYGRLALIANFISWRQIMSLTSAHLVHAQCLFTTT